MTVKICGVEICVEDKVESGRMVKDDNDEGKRDGRVKQIVVRRKTRVLEEERMKALRFLF